MAKKMYAYFFDEENNGIIDNWESCKKIITGTKARYKSFKNRLDAETWLNSGANYDYNKKSEKNKEILNSKLENGIYFDAGTGRGLGVEVRITDKNKKSLLEKLIDSNFKKFLTKKNWKINEFKNILLDRKRTNNYGELLGLYLALECAKRTSQKKIFGDSKLVIDYWSLNHFKKDNIEDETILLIEKVSQKRKEFEKNGGEVKFVSGDINPADLGFHK